MIQSISNGNVYEAFNMTVLLALLVLSLIISTHSSPFNGRRSPPRYSIVKLNTTFTLTPNNTWNRLTFYPRCENKNNVDNYVTIRIDKGTSQWNLTGDDINDLVAKEYFRTNLKFKPHVFKPEFFLELARNLTFVFVGDSQTLQLFVGLVNRLIEYCPRPSSPTDDPMEKYGTYCKSFNVSIFMSDDMYLTEPQAVQNIIGADVLIVGVGAWFKPLNEQSMDLYPTTSYNASLNWFTSYYRNCTENFRKQVLAVNPTAKVFWKLIPHVGRIDEMTLLHNITGLDHRNESMWSHSSVGSHWVPTFNSIVEHLAAAYDDTVIDWYTLSNLYLDYFAAMNKWMHCDTLHYCTTGLPKGGALLVQDALYDIVHRSDVTGKTGKSAGSNGHLRHHPHKSHDVSRW